MKNSLYRQKGFWTTFVAAVIIVSIVLVTEYQKQMFVPETGNIKVFGTLGIVLAIGLIFKWRYVREILMTVLMFSIGFIFFVLFNTESQFIVSFGILLTAMIVAFSLIAFSPSVRRYYKKK